MADSAFSGPLNVWGATPNLGGLGNTLDYNDAAGGPSLFLNGFGTMDPRNQFTYQPGGQKGAYGWLGGPDITIINAVPGTLSPVVIAGAQAAVAGTALTLATSSVGPITVGQSITNSATGATVTGLLAIDGTMSPVTFGSNTVGGLGLVTSGFQSIWDPTKALSRCVTVTSVGNDSAGSFLVKGYDVYGFPMSEAITGGNATLATGKKAFKYIASVTPAGTLTGSNVSVGVSDTYGLMLRSDLFQYFQIYWPDTTLISSNSGWTAAVTTSPATTTTGDVRGTYALQASPSNGIRRMVATLTIPLANIGTSAGLVGVTQA